MIYNWLTEETAPILLKFIDDQFHMKYEVKSRYDGINGTMKLISFTKDGSRFTIVIDKTGIKHSKELVELEGIEAFALQEIRNQKLEDLGV
jgi:hypothetical protein